MFVEFDDSPWRQRSWVQVYGDEVRAVLMESAIVWANCSDPSLSATQWPALVSTDAHCASIHHFSVNHLIVWVESGRYIVVMVRLDEVFQKAFGDCL